MCHDKVRQHAHHIGCDAVLLSPVNRIETHPETKVLDADGFAELAEKSDIPVFALGGVAPTDSNKPRNIMLMGIRQFESIQ